MDGFLWQYLKSRMAINTEKYHDVPWNSLCNGQQNEYRPDLMDFFSSARNENFAVSCCQKDQYYYTWKKAVKSVPKWNESEVSGSAVKKFTLMVQLSCVLVHYKDKKREIRQVDITVY